MTPPAARNDPYRKFNFMVEIDGITSTGFQFVDGLESVSDVIDYREGGEAATPRKLPGLNKFSNIILKRGFTANRELWEWRQTVVNGATERRNGAIIVLNEARQEVLRWFFENAWPSKWRVGGLDALESQVFVEEIELVIENLRLAE